MPTDTFKRILHVDDQRDIRSIVGLALGKLGGYTVLGCASGEEALAAAPGFDPELLLLDMNMPGMDGRDLLARLRELGVHAPAVFFTAKINPADLQGYRDASAIGTIHKPFDPLKLSRQLQEIWANRPAGGDATP